MPPAYGFGDTIFLFVYTINLFCVLSVSAETLLWPQVCLASICAVHVLETVHCVAALPRVTITITCLNAAKNTQLEGGCERARLHRRQLERHQQQEATTHYQCCEYWWEKCDNKDTLGSHTHRNTDVVVERSERLMRNNDEVCKLSSAWYQRVNIGLIFMFLNGNIWTWGVQRKMKYCGK